MKTIIVCRCVQSVNEEITGYGFMQAHSVGKMLEKQSLFPDRLVYADSMCKQTVLAIAVAMKQSRIQAEEIRSFLPVYSASVMDQIRFLSKERAHIGLALEENEVQKNKDRLNKAIICLAVAMSEAKERTALVVSHSLFAELAVTNLYFPLGLDEGDCLVYYVNTEQKKIADSTFIGHSIPSHSKF